jgi:hypothetical protein
MTGLLCGLACMPLPHAQAASSTAAQDDCHEQEPAGSETIAAPVHGCVDHADRIGSIVTSPAPSHPDKLAPVTASAAAPLQRIPAITPAVSVPLGSPGYFAPAIPLRL